MNGITRGRTGAVTVLTFCGLAPLIGCSGALVHTRGDAASVITNVSAIVSLPPRLGFGKAADQRRVARRTGDTLIDLTGGHAILADELPSTDSELIADGVRGLGEDPARTLTFAVIAARTDRVEASTMPVSPGQPRATRRYVDYTVRLDVRRSDGRDIMGSIETFATALANAPEIDAKGRTYGLQRAIDDAIAQAVHSFAPNLVAGAPFPKLVEIPQRVDAQALTGALGAVDKLRRLQVLYPEQSAEDLAALASSSARFLVIKAERLAAVGVAPGDLVSGMGGQNLGGRAALARNLARGSLPAMSIDRGGGRFLIGQTLMATAR